MPADGRSEAQIRAEIAAEREQLAEALADLRQGLSGKRRIAALAGGAAATGLATAVALKLIRAFRSG